MTYEKAHALFDLAIVKYQKTKEQHLNGEISDDDFLKARTEYKKAESKFDKAFAKAAQH